MNSNVSLWGCTGFDRYGEIYMQWSGRPKLLKLNILGNEYSIVDPALTPAEVSAAAVAA